MIIEELAYKVTIRAEEFLSGKKKVEQGAKDLEKGISDSMDEASESTGKAGTAIERVGKQVRKTADDTKRPFGLISGGFSGLANSAKEFGQQGKDAFSGVQAGAAKFLGLALSIEGTRRLFSSSVNSLVELGNTSSSLDMNARSLEGWQKGADAAGSSANAMTSALQKLKNAQNWSESGMGAPDDSTQAVMQLGAQTGVDILRAKDPGEMFRKTEEALRKLPKSQAQQWMQRLGYDSSLLPSILNGGLDRNQAHFEGASNVTDDMIKKAGEVKVIMGDLDQATGNLGNNLVKAFGPDVIDIMNTFNRWIDANGGKVIDFFKDTDKWVRQFSDALQGNKNAIHDWGQVAENFNLFSGFNKPVFDLKSMMDEKFKGNAAWEWFKENSDKDLFKSSGNAKYDEDRLLDALMKAESGGNPNAVSRSGAVGAYQFMPGTARDMGLRVDGSVDERRDPVKSREAARKYLGQLINRYDGNVDLALKAYNIGPTALDRWLSSGANPASLNSETSNYVGRVSKYYGSDLSQKASMGLMPASTQSMDNSQTSTTHIGTVQLNTNPQSIDAIAKSIEEQQRRSAMNGSFISGNR